MRRLRLPFALVPLIVLIVAGFGRAQGTKKVTGTISAITADSVTVKVGGTDLSFVVDDKVMVIAPGAGTRTRQAEASNSKPKLGDLLKAGDAVEVSYTEVGGSKLAAELRKVGAVGTAGVPANVANGTVTAVSATSLSIKGTAGGGSSFEQTYAITSETRVIGKGAGTAASKAGGKVAITDLVSSGDQVMISFKPEGSTLNATEVRVTMKSAPKKSS
jgi:hypothetical protein